MIKTYVYNRKAAKAFITILCKAKKHRKIRYSYILRELNLRGVYMSRVVLQNIMAYRRLYLSPIEFLVFCDVLYLDVQRVHYALLLTINDDPRARQAIEDAVSTVAVRAV